jgi:DNA-binding LacI/PurR family transcriptional regulator
MSEGENVLAVVSNAPRARAMRSLKQWIEEGVLPHGQPLPTEQALAQKLQVSRGTLRTALDMLSEEGLIRTHGRLRLVVAPEKNGQASIHTHGVILPAGHGNSSIQHDTPVAVDTVAHFQQAAKQPIRIGILGVWTGQPHQYVWNNVAMRAMETVASEQANITLCYFNRFQGIDKPRRSILEGVTALSAQGVERFVVLFRTTPAEIEALGSILDFGKTPLVCIQDDSPQPLPICQVSYDIEHSGFQAGTHLLNRGWRSLVMLAPFDAIWVWQRLRGVESSIRVQGLQPSEVLTVWPGSGQVPLEDVKDSYQECGRKVAREMLKNLPRPCGIIAPNDMTAYGVMDAAREMGLTPGVDFGIVGFDDSSESRTYSLTSLRPPIEVMGEEAIRLLLTGQPGEQSVLQSSFRSELVARTSSDFFKG